MLAKEGIQLILLLHMFNGVAGMVHSSEVNLRLAGVATFGLEQVPFFSGTYSSSNFRLLPFRDQTLDFVSMYL